jgi:type II secretory ATPase GspE/PulE/Tfp pilus assembly ATPase PilB-like protein
MFDPSKMNLDLENNTNEDNTKIPEEKTEEQEIQISEGSIKKEEIQISVNKNIQIQGEEVVDIQEESKKEDKDNEQDKYVEDETKKESVENKNDKDIDNDENNEEKESEKIIFDININSLDYLIRYLVSKQYDFFTLEPETDKIKVGFKKDNLEKEIKYIKYPTYTNIIIKAKSLTKLNVENTTSSQE